MADAVNEKGPYRTDGGTDAAADEVVTLHEWWTQRTPLHVRQRLERECANVARTLFGSGYVDDYYVSVAADFISIACYAYRWGRADGADDR